jgi:hypothetical protein
MFVDFTSQYATCNSLLGTWDYMIARDVKVQDDTEEVRKFLNSVTLQKMFDRVSWPDLNFFALVEPHGDMLPVRAVYNDVEAESTNIGIPPLTSKVPIWYGLSRVEDINRSISKDGESRQDYAGGSEGRTQAHHSWK